MAGTLAKALRAAGVSDVRDDATTRAAYSSDASLYRVPPAAVVRPRDTDDVVAAMTVCRNHGIPITARGAGTSVAGNAIGAGVVLDFSRHMNRVLNVDPEAATAVVQPGVVQVDLQREAARHGLRFGPDPSTFTRCTIGGMIGNNACGSRTLGYGRTDNNVAGLLVITGGAEHFDLVAGGTDPNASTALSSVHAIVAEGLATIRTEFGTFGRQVSGYALEHLLPENRFDLARMLVGSEGSLALVTEATVRLVRDPAHTALVVLGFDDIAAAGDATPQVLLSKPIACEGIDSRIVDVVRERRGADAVPPLPAGRAWLFVELAGGSTDQVMAAAQALVASSSATACRLVTDPREAAVLWRIRADGAGLAGRSPAGLPAHAGWEDAAVPPARLGDYLRDFESLMGEYRLTGLPYGHFGDGCLHIRLDFPLDRPDGALVFREFLRSAAGLVAGYGGSLSGEHGDGRARGELLPLMYSPHALALFADIKRALDPDGLLNPGIVIDPPPVEANLRAVQAHPMRRQLALTYRHDDGDFTKAIHRCTGVGKCRADNGPSGGVMCPSYLATREETDSTRGRARVLQEMINGSTITGGWRSPEVHAALDLCLSCKGCTSDCPAGVDMPALKAEVLHQAYRHRIRPRSHYALGWLPRWARLASSAPGVANALTAYPAVARIGMAAAGVDSRRRLPRFATQNFRTWFHATEHRRTLRGGDPVVLFVDTFTDYFTPEVGRATVGVLESAGYRPRLADDARCCGLTWISTGQLDAAKRILGRTIGALTPAAGAGIPIVGMEPSCTAVLRSDAIDLLGDSAEPVAAATRTLAELLAVRGWQPPSLDGHDIVAQPHCHHHAVMGWDADAALLEATGARVRRLSGCCGLAGNFGVEKGHYDVSVAVAEQQLLPALRDATSDTAVLADGYSCRTQINDLTDHRGKHLAELLGAPGTHHS